MRNKPLRYPVLQWAFDPEGGAGLRYIERPNPTPQEIPNVGDVLTLDFIVDAASGQPCPVRISRIEYMEQPHHTVVIPVVTRAG